MRVIVVDPGEEPKIIYVKDSEDWGLTYRNIISSLIFLWNEEWDINTQFSKRITLNNIQCCDYKYSSDEIYLNCIVDAQSAENKLIANRTFRYSKDAPKLYLAGRAVLFKGMCHPNGVVSLRDFSDKELKHLNSLLKGKALDKKDFNYLSQGESDSIDDSERYNGKYEFKTYGTKYESESLIRTENLGEFYGRD